MKPNLWLFVAVLGMSGCAKTQLQQQPEVTPKITVTNVDMPKIAGHHWVWHWPSWSLYRDDTGEEAIVITGDQVCIYDEKHFDACRRFETFPQITAYVAKQFHVAKELP